VKEHICHIIEIEDLYETRLEEYMAGKDVLIGIDMTSKKTKTLITTKFLLKNYSLNSENGDWHFQQRWKMLTNLY
jgi:hypothetical protein